MILSYSDFRRFDDKLDLILHHQRQIMASLAQLTQNLQDIRDLAAQYLALLVAKDQANAALQAQIVDLVNQHVTDVAEKQALLDGIDAAVTDSQATEDQLRAGIPGVPPTGGTPLNPSYPDNATFTAAAAAYTGPEAVTLDGAEVKAGTTPSLDYFTHSADGHIDTLGPTD